MLHLALEYIKNCQSEASFIAVSCLDGHCVCSLPIQSHYEYEEPVDCLSFHVPCFVLVV